MHATPGHHAPCPTALEQQKFLRRHADRTLETHMAWLFFKGSVVRKMKKSVRYAYLDFAHITARERVCREELRLNRRLARDVYLGLDVLQWDGCRLTLLPEDQAHPAWPVLDWLVRMRCLPPERMLDTLIIQKRVTPDAINALARALLRVYRCPLATPLTPQDVSDRLAHEQQINREVLCRPDVFLNGLRPLIERVETQISAVRVVLAQRVAKGRVGESHGDLRPQHICLRQQPAIIDALEFNPLLRTVDPFEELAGLDLECAVLGAPWIGPYLIRRMAQLLHDPEGAALVPFYRAYRGLLRARLALAHLLDLQKPVRHAKRWPVQAQKFIDAAQCAAHAANAGIYASL
jgi:aminoglycoside phosphotransferase family enzyme